MAKTWSRIGVVFVLLAVALLFFSGQPDRIAAPADRQLLASQNAAYLDATLNRALIGFGVLSALKASLAVIQGSSVTVSFGVGAAIAIGDVVQPVHDYVDIAWLSLLASAVALLSTRYLLQAAALIDSFMQGAVFFLLAVFLTVHWWRRQWTWLGDTLKDVLGVAAVAACAVSFLLPLSVWGAAKLSRAITAPTVLEAQQGFQQVRDSLFPDRAQKSEGVLATMKRLPEEIGQIAASLKEKSKELVLWTVKLVTGYIFDCIVFPLSVFLLLFGLTRLLMAYVLRVNFQTSLRQDIKGLREGK